MRIPDTTQAPTRMFSLILILKGLEESHVVRVNEFQQNWVRVVMGHNSYETLQTKNSNHWPWFFTYRKWFPENTVSYYVHGAPSFLKNRCSWISELWIHIRLQWMLNIPDTKDLERWKGKQYIKVILRRRKLWGINRKQSNTEVRMKMQCGSLWRRAGLLLLQFSYTTKATEKMRSQETRDTKLQLLLYQNNSQRLSSTRVEYSVLIHWELL